MFSLLPLPYRLGIICLLLLGLFSLGYGMGYLHEHDKFVSYQAQIKQEAADQAAHVKDIEAQHQKLLEDTKNDYENRLANNTAYWQRVLHSATSPYGLSKTSTAAVSSVASSPNTLSDSAISKLPMPGQLVMDCQATTVQLESLQAWVIATLKE